MGKLHTVHWTYIHALLLVSFQVTIRLWDQHAEQWGYSSVIYACELWIHQSKWRPLYANTRLSSIYFHWVYDLIAGGFIANILPDLSIGVEQEQELSWTYRSWSHLISVKLPTSPPLATRDSGNQSKSPRTASVPKALCKHLPLLFMGLSESQLRVGKDNKYNCFITQFNNPVEVGQHIIPPSWIAMYIYIYIY